MSDAKFTKGVWVIKEAIAYKNQIRVKDKKGKQGKIIGNIRTRDDAYLIAAAPEMYEMLKSLSEMSSEDAKLYLENSSDVVELLAKARGEK